MPAVLDTIRLRQATWEPTVAPDRRAWAYPLKEGGKVLGLASRGAAVLAGGIDESAMSFPAIITTEQVDRVGDVVIAEGVDTKDYAKNPVVFFGHQAMPLPIGTSMDPDGVLHVYPTEEGEVVARCYVAQKGNWAETAQDIFQLVKDGILCAVSIGFDPLSEPIRLDTGGHQFDQWSLLEWSVVGVPANPGCHIVRDYLSRGRIAGKRIDPQLVKSLEPLATPIKVWANGTGTGEVAMSKKWGKSRRSQKASLAEGSGPQGGYVVDEDEEEDRLNKGEDEDHLAGHEETVGAIKAVMHHHKEDAHPDGPHDAFFHPVKGHVHHHHHKEAEAGHLARVKDDLERIDGCQTVTQHHEPPAEPGFHKVYGSDTEAEGPADKPEELEPKPQPSGELGEQKRLAKLFAAMPRGALRSYVRSMKEDASNAIQECVSRKIPKLIDEGYAQDQAAAIAYSMCGEKAEKSHRKEAEADEGATTADEVGLSPTAKYLHNVHKAHKECEADVPAWHPDLADFHKSTHKECKRLAKRFHQMEFDYKEAEADDPDHDGDQHEAEDEDTATDEALERYRELPFWRFKQLTRSALILLNETVGFLGEHVREDNLTGQQRGALKFYRRALMDLGNRLTGTGWGNAQDGVGLDESRILAKLNTIEQAQQKQEKRLAPLAGDRR